MTRTIDDFLPAICGCNMAAQTAPRINHTEEAGSDDEEVFFVNAIKDSGNQPAVVTCANLLNIGSLLSCSVLEVIVASLKE